MFRIRTFVAAATLVIPLQAGDTLHQVSVIDALLIGVYDGPTTVGDLRKLGDFGLGTVNRLDGEMVALDGQFYQITADGVVRLLDESARTPFAAVASFEADASITVPHGTDFAALKATLDGGLPSKNNFYAIRIDASFPILRLRSVPAQTSAYPPLTAVVAKQTVWTHEDVAGTLVGFRCPPYAAGINVPGYHFHFISDDRRFGGHVLDLTIDSATARVDTLRRLILELPDDKSFAQAPLDPTSTEAIQNVERGETAR